MLYNSWRSDDRFQLTFYLGLLEQNYSFIDKILISISFVHLRIFYIIWNLHNQAQTLNSSFILAGAKTYSWTLNYKLQAKKNH